MRLKPLAFACLATTALVPASAMAQPGFEEVIRQSIKAWITENLVFPGGGVTLVFDGGIEVVPTEPGSYHLTIASTELIAEDQISMRMGPIEADLTPDADGVIWDVTWTLPSAIDVEDLALGDQVTITIGGNSGAGTFSTALETFLNIDASLSDLSMVVPQEGVELAVAEISLVGNSVELGDGLYDTTDDFSLRGFSVLGPDVDMRIDTIAAVGSPGTELEFAL